MTTISIQINDELAAAVRELAQLPEEEQRQYAQRIYELKLAALRHEIEKGLASPDDGELDMEEIKREARAEWEAGKNS